MAYFKQFPVYIASKQFYQDIQPVLRNTKLPIRMRDQLERAAGSISLNIAEGAGKQTPPDKKRFYLAARGSAYECIAALELLVIVDPNKEQYLVFEEKLVTICKMLSGLIRYMQRQK